jgi:HEPN domain-containing protein
MSAQHEEALRLLKLADRDIAAFHALRQHPEVDAAASLFHARQAIEKCLKAVLTERYVLVPRSHDISNLARLAGEYRMAVPCSMRTLDLLAPYTVHFRYDEIESDRPPLPEVDEMLIAVRRWAHGLVAVE